MAQSVSDSTNLIIERFNQRVRYLTSDRASVYGKFPVKDRSMYEGGDLNEAVTGMYNGSFMATGPDPDTVPPPGKVKVQRCKIQKCFFLASYGRDWFLDAMTQGKGAFTPQKILTLDRTTAYVKQMLERQALGDGTGVLVTSIGTVTGVTAANWTFPVSLNESVFLKEGARVVFAATTGDRANLPNATFRDVPTKGYYTVKYNVPGTTTATITIEEASPGTSSPVATDSCIMYGAVREDAISGTTNVGREMYGFDAIISASGAILQVDTDLGFLATGGFEGLSPTNYGWWKSHEVDAGGTRILGPSVFNELATRMVTHGVDEPDMIDEYVTHPDRIKDYEETLTPGIRYAVSGSAPTDAPGGTSASLSETRKYLQYGSKNIVPNKYCPEAKCFAPRYSELGRYVLLDFSFRPEHDDYSGRPATQGDALAIMQLGTTNRGAHGVIKALKTT